MTASNNTIFVNFTGPNRGVVKSQTEDTDGPNGPTRPARAQQRPRPLIRNRDLKVIGRMAA
jgi:hypothetical protein